MDFKFMIGLGTEQWILIALLVVMVVVLIVLPMFTNKRRNKAVNELYSSIRPGDVIKTVGGIIGEVKEIKEISPVDKQMVIETGAEGSKTTMVFDIQAVYQVITKTAAPEPVQVAPVASESVEQSVEVKEEPTVASDETVAVVDTADQTAAAEEPATEETASVTESAAKTAPANTTRAKKSTSAKK